MPRSNNAVASRARRKKILKMAKGYYGARKNVWTVAKNAVEKALLYAYVGRKLKKRQFRSLWIQRINAGARQHGMSYSQFMGTPEIGGLTTPQALELIRALRGVNIVGCDLVEVSPPYDTTGNTALTGANLLYELLCVLPGVSTK